MANQLGVSATRKMMKGFAAWQNFVVESFPWLEVDRGANDFKATVRFRPFADGSLAAIAADSCRVTRDALGVRHAEAGHLKILWQRAGSMGIEQDGRSCRLDAGMTAICDTGRPYRLTLADNAHLVVLTLPYKSVIGWERLSERVCGTPLKDRAVFGAALAASLVLLEDAPPPADDGADRVLQGVRSMLSASLHQSSEREKPSSLPLELDGVTNYILTHLDDRDLSPDALASILRISRRTLYHLFKEQATTPSRFIRDVRLQAVRRALIDPTNAGKSLLDIALDHGFTDSASFCRTFKAAYGLSPSVWRGREIAGGTDS